ERRQGLEVRERIGEIVLARPDGRKADSAGQPHLLHVLGEAGGLRVFRAVLDGEREAESHTVRGIYAPLTVTSSACPHGLAFRSGSSLTGRPARRARYGQAPGSSRGPCALERRLSIRVTLSSRPSKTKSTMGIVLPIGGIIPVTVMDSWALRSPSWYRRWPRPGRKVLAGAA